MPALDFPASPTLNQVYTANGKSWIWSGNSWNPYGAGLPDKYVTYSKIQDVSAASRLLGRGSLSGSGTVEEISVGNGLSISGGLLNITGNFITGGSQSVQEIYIDAGAMLTGISGASPSSVSVSNSGIAYDCFNFDASTSGYAQFKLKLPDYNLGNLKARFDWTTSGASGAVVWGIQGVAIGDGDSLSTAWGSPQEIADSFVTGTGVHVTSSTPEITLAGSPQANDLLFFRVYRDTFDAGDTLAVNASLLGLKLQYTGIQIQSW